MTETRTYHNRSNQRRRKTMRTWVKHRPFSIILMVSLAVVLRLARSTTAWNVGHGGSGGRHRAATFARVEVAPLQQQRCSPYPRKQLPEDLVSSPLLMSQEQYHDDDFDNDERDNESESLSSINSDTTKNNHQEVSLNNGKRDKEKQNITAVAERKMRVAAAQEKIDRILNGPDPPFDMEHEMKRVVQITAAGPEEGREEDGDDSDHDELEQEAKVSRLEKDLYDAVKHQDYERAATAKRELDRGHLDNCGAVLQANAAFYRAFSQKDYDAMESLWLHDATSTCIHPTPAGPLIGSKSVLGAWKRMFASQDYSFQRNWMEPVDIRLSMKGACTAVVTCTERVYARRFVRGRKRQTELLNQLLATNVFRKVRGKWHLTHHHSSWHPDSDLAQRVREIQQQQQTSSGGGGNSIVNRGIGGKGRAQTGMVQPPSSMLDRYNLPKSNIIINNNNKNSKRNRDEEDDINAKIGMDGILGTNNFEPLLGDDNSKKSEGGSKQQPIKVVGSLSDLLSGGLGDLLGGAAGAGGADAGAAGGGSAIIRFSSQMDDGPTQEDDDEVTDAIADAFSAIDNASDDDDDNDSDDGYDNDDGRSEAIMIKQWTPSMDSASPSKQGGTSASPSSSSSTGGGNNIVDNKGGTASSSSSSPPKDALLRQNCISALRKLCNEGCISPNQKRVLLTDIITCSAKGEFSMVEVAYELLLTGEEEQGEAGGEARQSSSSSASSSSQDTAKNTAADIAEEEFADQCRVFAHSLLQESEAAASTR